MSKSTITEIYGLAPSDPSLKKHFVDHRCPFTASKCSKYLKGENDPTGVCAVSHGTSASDVIVCPNRLYGDNYATLRLISSEVYGAANFVIGGTTKNLKNELHKSQTETVVVFGRNSGHEIVIPSKTKMSLDWVLQHYDLGRNSTNFVAVEVQSMDTTGNYRANLESWRDFHNGSNAPIIPSSHGINWANVYKRSISQLIRKGLVLRELPNFDGLFFIIPDNVFERIENTLGSVKELDETGRDIISIRTYNTESQTASGLKSVRALNYNIEEFAAAHNSKPETNVVEKLQHNLRNIL